MVKLTALQKKTICYLAPLIVLLLGTLLFYFLFVRVKPNDKILTTSQGEALFANENPTFKVQFGDKDNPDGQWVRFETESSVISPFASTKKKNIFTQIAEIFAPTDKVGIEMSLRGVDFSETKSDGKTQYDEELQKVADILGTEEIRTTTVLTEMGREIGENNDDQIISKQTIVNQNVADGIDLEYQILTGLGLKEEIVINDLEAYRNSCDDGCKLPLNEFVFDLKMDEGVSLKKGWYTVKGKSTETYYFVDSRGKYLAHFLPNYATDGSGAKTYNVGLIVSQKEGANYEVKVTVDTDWLLDEDRVYPIRIDPSIVHDEASDFNGGVFDRSENVVGPKVQLLLAKAPVVDANTVALLHLDEVSGSGAYLLDSSANGNNGTPTGTTYINGRVSGARNLNGSNNVINIGSSTSLDFGNNGPFTFSAWVKPTTLVNYAGFISKDTAGRASPYSYMTTFMADGRLEVYNGSAWADVCPAGSISNGNWYYVTFAYNGTYMYGYVNGTLCGSVAFTYTDNIAHEVTIGSWYAASSIYDFNGIIDEVHISNIARTASQIQNSYLEGVSNFSGLYTSSALDLGSPMSGMTMSWLGSGIKTGDGETPYSTTGMVAQWNFNETSGTSAVSGGTCGTSCNGTLAGMTTTGQDAAAMTGWTANNRRWGAGALMFDGTNDTVSIPSSSNVDFDYNQNFSISTWVNIPPNQANTTYTQNEIIFKYNGGEARYPYVFRLNNQTFATADIGKLNIYRWDGTNVAGIISSKPINDSKWHNIVYSKNGSTLSLYIDGKLDATTTDTTTTTTTNSSPLYLGSRANTAYWFTGMMDSTSFYSRALSANEILSNYQSGNIEFQYRTSTDNSTWSDWTSYNDGALMFDGTDDDVILGGESTFDFERTATFSIEAWIKTSYTGDVQNILSKMDNVAPFSGYDLHVRTTGYIAFIINNTWSTNTLMVTTSGTVCNDGSWHHIVVTYAGTSIPSGVHIYVDGVDQSLTTNYNSLSASTLNNISLNIGSRNNAAYFFNGVIDSARVYSRVLGASEIATNYTSPYWDTPSDSTSLLAQWSLSETSGTTATATGLCSIGSTICNGTLTNFSDTTGRDATSNTGWTSTTKRASDSLWESFNNSYLYKTTDTGLVGYWPMNEASGTSVADVKSSYTGTASTTTIIDGKHSYGRSFNGSSSGIALASGSAANITGDITFEAWIKPLSFAAAQGVVTKSSQYAVYINTSGYVAWADSSNWSFANFGYKDIGLRTGVWQHIAVTKTGGVVNIYLNGALKVSQSFGSAITSTTNIMNIGCYSGASACASAYFNGPIDEVRIFNAALSAATINADYLQGVISKGNNIFQSSSSLKVESTASTKLTSGSYAYDSNTLALWHMDESSGTGAYIKDSSVNARHATPTGTTFTSPGKIGGARTFNGTSDYIAGPDMAATTNLTIEAWFKTTSTAAGTIASNGTSWASTDIDWLLYLSGSGYAIFRVYRFSAGISVTTTTAYNDGNWHHVAGVISGTSASIYIDGVLKASQTVPSYTANTKNFQIGVRPGRADYFFNGSIDEVRLSNTARTASEIADAYSLGKDSYINQVVTSTDLSAKNTVSVDIAVDRPGEYMSTILGENSYANNESDPNTVGLWDFNGSNIEAAYRDKSAGQNNGVTTYYGIEYGIRSTNATFIINQYGGASNAGEMDITCTGGDAACVIVTKDGTTLSTPTINSGVAMVDGTTGINWLMYSPSLAAQGITPYSGASDNYIAVYYTGSAWQYDSNSAYVTFTPQPYNILVCVITRFTSTTQKNIYPIISQGKVGNGMVFDGTDDYISTASIGYGTGNLLSVEAWVKTSTCTGTDGYCYIVTKGQTIGATPYTLSIISTGSFLFSIQGTSVSSLKGGYNDGQWHYVVGTLSGTTASIYVDGVFQASGTVTPTTNTDLVTIGGDDGNPIYRPFNGTIDEVRISNVARTIDEIRQTYETVLRTQNIKVTFGAFLASGNLITGSGDYSFSIDATKYALAELGSGVYVGDKIIVRENYNGTEYIAQGTVSAVTSATGAVTVSSWDSGSTFPTSGYTVSANVFKWQREYIPVKNRALASQVNATTLLTFRLNDGKEGRNIWIDNLRTSTGYLSASTGEAITFTNSARYVQYKAILSSWDSNVTPYISQVQLDYQSAAPALEQLMRHGKWFDSAGAKKNFWWVGTH